MCGCARTEAALVISGSAAATAALAWALRELGELQVYDEAYTVVVALDEVGTVRELEARLSDA